MHAIGTADSLRLPAAAPLRRIALPRAPPSRDSFSRHCVISAYLAATIFALALFLLRHGAVSGLPRFIYTALSSRLLPLHAAHAEMTCRYTGFRVPSFVGVMPMPSVYTTGITRYFCLVYRRRLTTHARLYALLVLTISQQLSRRFLSLREMPSSTREPWFQPSISHRLYILHCLLVSQCTILHLSDIHRLCLQFFHMRLIFRGPLIATSSDIIILFY